MADQLTGRALDVACAKAMGYTISDCYGPGTVHWLRPDGIETVYGGYGGALPRFSTDAARIPEMTAWLEARAYNLEFCWNDRAKLYRARGDHVVEGATLQEALARLVVAVGEAQP